MFTIHIVIGLPGSGKSVLLINKENKGEVIIDDWGVWNKDNQWDKLKTTYKENNHIYISSIDFCKSDFLKEFKAKILEQFPNTNFAYTYFENSPHKCVQNVLNRSKEMGDTYFTKNGRTLMYGRIAPIEVNSIIINRPMWEGAVEQIFKLYPNYIIPSNITPTKIFK